MPRAWFAGVIIVLIALFAQGTPISRADPGTKEPCPDGGANTLDCSADPGVYGVEMRTLAAEMAANPAPGLTPIPVNPKTLYGRAYRRVLRETDIYDAPDGKAVGHIDAGLNFVNAGQDVNGWVRIGPNQWLPKEALAPVNSTVSKFSGVALPDGFPERPFGWILVNTQPSRVPGAKPLAGTPAVRRYTLVNLFAVETIDSWNWYLIGPNQWIHQRQVARLLPVKRPEGVSGKWFAIDLYEQTLTAYENDKAVFATLISSGMPQWPTSEGLFKIWDRQESVTMTGASGQPDFFNLPQVPWALYFKRHEQSIHGAYWHDGFGYRRSHGCVNLSMTDAQWAFDWTRDQSDAYAYIYHSGEYRPGAIR
jgi:hypothetical protein